MELLQEGWFTQMCVNIKWLWLRLLTDKRIRLGRSKEDVSQVYGEATFFCASLDDRKILKENKSMFEAFIL